MSIRQGYNQWAASYDSDRNLTRDLDAEVTRDLLGGQRANIVLELGCGTGKNSEFLAQFAGRLLALDFSAAMLQQAQARAYAQPPHFALADLNQPWPIASACVDLLTCNLVLEHIADLGSFFVEAGRVLGSSGRFFISELHPAKRYLGKQAVYQQDREAVEIPGYIHHVSDFVNCAQRNGFALDHLGEWWHAEDADKPPRLITFIFEKVAASVIR